MEKENNMSEIYRKEIIYLAERCKDVDVLKRVYTILYFNKVF